MVVTEDYMIRTKSDSSALLKLIYGNENALVMIESGSKLVLTELAAGDDANTYSTLLDLTMGEILIKSQKLHTPDSQFEVKTPTSVVGVRGTKFAVKVEVESIE